MERSFGLVSTLIRYCFVFSLRLVTRILLVLWVLIGFLWYFLYCNWPLRLLWIRFYDTHSKTAVRGESARGGGGGGKPVRIFLFFLTTISVGRHNNIQCNELIRNLRRNIFLGALTV